MGLLLTNTAVGPGPSVALEPPSFRINSISDQSAPGPIGRQEQRPAWVPGESGSSTVQIASGWLVKMSNAGACRRSSVSASAQVASMTGPERADKGSFARTTDSENPVEPARSKWSEAICAVL